MAFLNHTPCHFKKVVDHINGKKLDNKLENLQIITNRQNSTKDRTKKYTGVRKSSSKKWRADIYVDNKQVYLGSFDSELEAYNAYKNKLKTLKND